MVIGDEDVYDLKTDKLFETYSEYFVSFRSFTKGRAMKLIPVSEFEFPEPGPEHFKLTCKNHPTAEYSTKNPYLRSLHFLRGPDEHPFTECSCPFGDLVVVVE